MVDENIYFNSYPIFLSSCATTKKETLYKRLGGKEGIEKITDNLIKNIGKDKEIFHYFAKTNISHFRRGLNLHLCDVSDGPCRYDGDSMVDIHTGMNINKSDFNHLVELLINAMEEANVNIRTQNQLLARLAPLREQVIHH
ncbi:group I truncated hemoglobin [Pleionea sediminis]|uniref:group I truncated hemoglobin n=1 Tax=Pleionea sediminis TaxID=2569479 RepID=UPI001FEB0CCC|nr:group 1 truncated hemoglobin [Pleionea sediminis]